MKIAIQGASGKMGKALLTMIESSPREWTCVLEGEKKTGSSAWKKAPADLVIDFSLPAGTRQLLAALKSRPRPLVSGTTGLTVADMKSLRAYARKAPVFWSANMSLGVAVLKKALREMALLEDFDFQIEEIHHNQKRDAPSGTALALQDTLQKNLGKKKISRPLSIRGGGVPGLHRVWAFGPEEWLCFEHTALDRKLFARGALTVGKWLVKKRPGFYTMDDFLEEAAKRKK